MNDKKQRAAALLREFNGDKYVFGLGCIDRLGELAARFGRRASVITSGVGKNWGPALHQATQNALDAAGIELAGEPIAGALPNSPLEDVYRQSHELARQRPEVVVITGGGSCIDAAKAAVAHWALGDIHPRLQDYFGVGELSRMLHQAGRAMRPMVACQIASGSGSHLTKYSNVTNMQTSQKMLIIDEAVIPLAAMFDYELSRSMPLGLTMDGGLDGVAHCLEVLYGIPEDKLEAAATVSLLGIDLIVNNLHAACDDLDDLAAREALGLGTDMGGQAIMIGSTNGAHLTSFSLVDILPHGRACALMNPYYTVFFAPSIPERMRMVGRIYKEAGYSKADFDSLNGHDLGMAVAEAMLEQSTQIGFPTTLSEVEGFTDAHIGRILSAAKNPKLASKLKSTPVALSAEMVDDYLGPVLEAARTGDFSRIKHLPS
ncbi:MAG: iron-containing alcohol dehydrogenase [Planctomycetota bacterium]|nr:iron-containing alcohol dehydrogenase [Planctomycetota bacterium]